MVDRLTPEQRSDLMRKVRGKDTAPEMIVGRLAHGAGFRYRLHRKDLPGKPEQLPTPIFRARVLRQVHARVSRIVWKGFAPLSLAVSTVVRTSASVFAAHMAR
jgi:DNA mismatch endonuclease Vsr